MLELSEKYLILWSHDIYVKKIQVQACKFVIADLKRKGQKDGAHDYTEERLPIFRVSVTGFGFRGPVSIFASRSSVLIHNDS